MADIADNVVARYQPGGDIYATLLSQYGQADADYIAQAAATGERAQLTEAIAYVRHGAALNDSTAGIFLDQILTDPLDAPLDALDAGVKKLFDSEGIKTILTIAVIGVVVVLVVKSS